jgi:hypothetical protein
VSWKTELQPRISPLPNLHRRWFTGKIVCKDEGWSFWSSASGSSRVDSYHYEENGKTLALGGEGGSDSEGIIIPRHLSWDDDASKTLEEIDVNRILFNVTAAIQWCGSSVLFSYDWK